MMKYVAMLVIALLLGAPVASLAAEKDVEKFPSCQYCGMNREKFGSTRMLVEYGDGSAVGTCSIHCTAVDLAQSFGKAIDGIKAADFNSGKLVDVGKATWVIGAGVPGVMSKKSRVAFAERSAAEAFQKEKGGEIADFTAAITSTYGDMWEDTMMIRKKRTSGGGGMGGMKSMGK